VELAALAVGEAVAPPPAMVAVGFAGALVGVDAPGETDSPVGVAIPGVVHAASARTDTHPAARMSTLDREDFNIKSGSNCAEQTGHDGQQVTNDIAMQHCVSVQMDTPLQQLFKPMPKSMDRAWQRLKNCRLSFEHSLTLLVLDIKLHYAH
jgi:hypothetical protein